MKIVVMGAGIIGVASAWYLTKAGHEVTVLDRNAGPACETSFANGGQISVSHAEPWANPSAPWKLIKWLGREDAPLLFRLRADPAQWSWALRFLNECRASRSTHNMIQLVRLGTYSRESLQALRAETNIQYHQLTRGILHYYTNPREFRLAIEPARVMRDIGCDRQVIDRDQVLQLEPAFAASHARIAGATYTSADESGDVNAFTVGLAKQCEQRGAKFRFGVRIQKLLVKGDTLDGIEIASKEGAYETVKADAYVLALGSFSRDIAKSAGVNLHIHPVKGYSITLPVLDPSKAPTVSLTDDEYKLVFSRFGSHLRIAGTAEFNGYNMTLNRTRCEAITARTLDIFPGASRPELAQPWTGLRPATPGNIPYIGRSKIRKLFLNTGHGTLGWTHGCGSGRAIADIIDGSDPEVNFTFTGLDRRMRITSLAQKPLRRRAPY